VKRPLLLDLFCGAGGAAVGYHRAGFDVVGVDIKPQPHYPFEFVQMDALLFLMEDDFEYQDMRRGFDAVHASPPCQAFSDLRNMHNAKLHADLLSPTREMLRRFGLPYAIENVRGAGWSSPIQLCGSAFGLRVRRHRMFETSFPILAPGCFHDSEFVTVTGGGPNPGSFSRPAGGGPHRKPKNVADAGDAMGIDWMTRDELNEAIPPAYTQFIGEQLLEHLRRAA
jgi:DNA (cytosine-5)-methyltransferase 1